MHNMFDALAIDKINKTPLLLKIEAKLRKRGKYLSPKKAIAIIFNIISNRVEHNYTVCT